LSHPSPHLPYLHSFPTRRSSDLGTELPRPACVCNFTPDASRLQRYGKGSPFTSLLHQRREHDVGDEAQVRRLRLRSKGSRATLRSEEHTSELQSRENLVCRLLLE